MRMGQVRRIVGGIMVQKYPIILKTAGEIMKNRSRAMGRESSSPQKVYCGGRLRAPLKLSNRPSRVTSKDGIPPLGKLAVSNIRTKARKGIHKKMPYSDIKMIDTVVSVRHFGFAESM